MTNRTHYTDRAKCQNCGRTIWLRSTHTNSATGEPGYSWASRQRTAAVTCERKSYGVTVSHLPDPDTIRWACPHGCAYLVDRDDTGDTLICPLCEDEWSVDALNDR